MTPASVPAPPAPEGGEVVRVSASISWHTVAVVVGTLVSALAGGGVAGSHYSVSSKLDAVADGQRALESKYLEGQKALELKFARLEGRDTDAQVAELRRLVSDLQTQVAEMRGRGEKR